MLVEPGVLGCHGGVDYMGGKLVVTDEGPVFYMERCQDFSVLRYYLGGKFAVRVLQLFERRDLGEERHRQQKKGDGEHRERQKTPENSCYTLLCFRFHSRYYNSQN